MGNLHAAFAGLGFRVGGRVTVLRSSFKSVFRVPYNFILLFFCGPGGWSQSVFCA